MPNRHPPRRLGALPPRALLLALAIAAPAAPAQQRLPTVVVSATRHALPLADAPAAVSVVERETIEQRGADNVLDALRGETGVTVFGRTIGGRRALALRGFDPKHTLFLVDGRRISASDGVIGHSDFQLDWVPVEEIERIEVVRGPLAALYGAEALGGVVQVFTRAPARERFDASATLEGAAADGDRGGDGHRAAARLSAPLGAALAGTLAASDTRREAIDSALDPRLTDLEGRHKQDVSWRLRWTPSARHALDLEHRLGHEERHARAVERGGQRRLYRSDSDLDRRHAALSWSAGWGGAGDWHSLLRAYGSRLAMTNRRDNGVAALRPNTLRDRVADAQLAGRVGGHLLTGGVELRDETLRNEALPGGEADAAHRSAYMQDELALGTSVTVTAGLRRDHHERFGGEWSPRLYAVWRLAPQWVVKGGYSRGFKPPTLKQITPGYQEDEGPFTYLSNPALRAETSDGVELGIAWGTTAAGVQAMLFDNRVDDLIVPRPTGVTVPRTVFRFENIDRARLRGAELSARWQPAAAWTLAANYQYLQAEDGDGQRIEKRPRHQLGASLEWAAGPWRATLQLDHAAEQLLASPVPGQPLQPAPSLTFVGASVSRELGSHLGLLVGVRNLGDVNPAEKSPLYTWGEAPRTLRVALRGRW